MKVLKVSTEETSDKVFTDAEKDLGHIPDPEPYINVLPPTFSWNHRLLVKLSARPGTSVADYMMYLCLDKTSKLTRNKIIERLSNFSDVKVYGDAFVFKMEANGYDELERAKYIHMDEFFIDSAKTGVHAEQYLRKLLKKADKRK